jgi:hypothetical protein
MSFERQGQMIRAPADILTRRVGTCLDLALLFASCLEQAGLTIVVLLEGHALVGFWLTDQDFSTPVVDDAQALRKRVQLQEMVLVETTMLTGDHPARFRQAVDAGANRTRQSRLSSLSTSEGPGRRKSAHSTSAGRQQTRLNRKSRPPSHTNSTPRPFSRKSSRPRRRQRSASSQGSKAGRIGARKLMSEADR